MLPVALFRFHRSLAAHIVLEDPVASGRVPMASMVPVQIVPCPTYIAGCF